MFVGDFVGEFVVEVGLSDGDKLGEVDGEALGLLLGAALGAVLGDAVLSVGLAEGLTDGDTVGCMFAYTSTSHNVNILPVPGSLMFTKRPTASHVTSTVAPASTELCPLFPQLKFSVPSPSVFPT